MRDLLANTDFAALTSNASNKPNNPSEAHVNDSCKDGGAKKEKSVDKMMLAGFCSGRRAELCGLGGIVRDGSYGF